MFGGGCVDWWSRKQKTVTLSTAEAENVALCELGKEVMFLKQVHMFMQPQCKDYSVLVFEDNGGAIKFSQKTVSGGRTRHIDVRYHYVRHLERERKVKIGYVPTKFQHAVRFAKGWSKEVFNRHADIIMGNV
ncbi:unnamed protein product [Choristocarpus tenellus]